MCVNRGPDDNQDRCAITAYNYKKVYMCLCKGDLCNNSPLSRTIWWSPFGIGNEGGFLYYRFNLTIIFVLIFFIFNTFTQIRLL